MNNTTIDEETTSEFSEETEELNPPKKKKGKYIVIAAVAAVVIIALLLLMTGGREEQSNAVSAEPVTSRDIEVTINGTGTIQPIHSGTIVAMVTGDILSDSFEIGDQVEKDQVLYTVDGKSAETALEQAQLGVDQANIAYDQAKRMVGDLTVKSTVSGQISAIHVKKGDSVAVGMPVVTVTDNATMTLKCNFNSVDAGNIHAGDAAQVVISATGETVPGKVTEVSGFTNVGAGGTLVQAVEVSVANPGGITGGMEATARVGTYACQTGGAFEYNTQTQVLAKANGTVDRILVSEGTAVKPGTALAELDGGPVSDQLKSAELGVRNANLALKNAQDMADNYRIKAPISGTVTQKDLGAGDNIGQAGTTVMAVVSDLSALTFDMMIDERDIPKVRMDQKVRITVDALPGEEFTGYVDTININGIAANGMTSYPVTVMVEDAGPELLPGMNVSADIMVEELQNVLTVPISAVGRGNTVQLVPAEAISRQDGSIDRSLAEKVEIAIGSNDSNYVQVVSGLKEGDLVLCESVMTKDGKRDRKSGSAAENG